MAALRRNWPNAGKYDGPTAYKLQQDWMRLRIADIDFVLDTILARAREAGSGALYQLIDPERIGLMGHSLELCIFSINA
jgi:predicted dienelactone hydrolase